MRIFDAIDDDDVPDAGNGLRDGDGEETIDGADDRLGPIRGVLPGLALCAPFWIAVIWLFW
jgi:hypothetical protein